MKKQSFNIYFLLLSIALTASTTTSAFTLDSKQRTLSSTSTTTSLLVVWDPKHNAEHNGMSDLSSEENEPPLIEFPTPSQRAALKKEASKRQARKKMPQYALAASDQLGSFSDTTLSEIWELLQEHEMIQVKGFSPEDKKMVYNLAMQLCSQLEWEQERQINDDVSLPVAMLSYKGHSALLYSPTLDNDHPKKFILRTSVGQKNTWTARIKAPRDNRGQIIRE